MMIKNIRKKQKIETIDIILENIKKKYKIYVV